MKGFFITGTDTEIGKTFCTAALTHAFTALGRRVAPIKSLAAGQELVDGRWINEDVQTLLAAQSLGLSDTQVGPLQFREPCAPHIAARLEGRRIEREPLLAAIRASADSGDLALVEGVGGFRVPLTPEWDTADLAVDLGLPVILVVGMRLGCINHALLTAEAVRARGLRLAAWVANTVEAGQPHVTDNLQALQSGLGVPCLGHLPRYSRPADPRQAAAQLNSSALSALLA
ncbi:MAG: dethiobiotin synthase [Roseateles depolymerans]|uniref:ATP-dependent dethiobiotin synthetase BioD n=1 Tax=Roseateles depolymerans TaxID=76731 RepID=A0A2W5FPC5_9BURK|nr:MAG: dethiobiotin synthase [Roseateles depolymerans]